MGLGGGGGEQEHYTLIHVVSQCWHDHFGPNDHNCLCSADRGL